MIPLASETVFKLSSSWAAWVGAKLEDTELYVEVQGRGGVLEVGGLYVHRDGSVLRDVMPLVAKPLVVRQKRRPANVAPSSSSEADGGLRAPPLPPPPDASNP